MRRLQLSYSLYSIALQIPIASFVYAGYKVLPSFSHAREANEARPRRQPQAQDILCNQYHNS